MLAGNLQGGRVAAAGDHQRHSRVEIAAFDGAEDGVEVAATARDHYRDLWRVALLVAQFVAHAMPSIMTRAAASASGARDETSPTRRPPAVAVPATTCASCSGWQKMRKPRPRLKTRAISSHAIVPWR